MTKSTRKIEFGDFQTPVPLALQCCRLIEREFGQPNTVIEPTCGKGAFVLAAAQTFSNSLLHGYEIRHAYLDGARMRLADASNRVEFQRQDFFQVDWPAVRDSIPGSVLFLGNPPWVTNSQLGSLDSTNLPVKSNRESHRGLDAMTGKSNFDLSEYIVQTLLDAMRNDEDSLAMLVKTTTARRVLRAAWCKGKVFTHASLRQIDAAKHFGVNVAASLLMLQPTVKPRRTQVCFQAGNLEEPATEIAVGWNRGKLVADPVAARATGRLESPSQQRNWRSGVKHDLSRVLELTDDCGQLRTRGGDVVEIENDRVYPLAKGADVANGRTDCQSRRLLLPQRRINESSESFAEKLPMTFDYLQQNASAFDARKSSIYRNRDRFAVFGIGDYTFAPWKIAICGLYKRLTFTLFGPIEGRPVIFDDTVYFLGFQRQNEAQRVRDFLSSDAVTLFFQARVFWDAKRPITAELLRALDLSPKSIARLNRR